MDDVTSTRTEPKAKDRSRFAIFYERDAPSLDETGMMGIQVHRGGDGRLAETPRCGGVGGIGHHTTVPSLW
jgi:hypothetical protein